MFLSISSLSRTVRIYTLLLARVLLRVFETMQSQGLMLLLEEPVVYKNDNSHRISSIIAVCEDLSLCRQAFLTRRFSE